MASIDYKIVFDSVKTTAVMKALSKRWRGGEETYVKVLEDI